MRCPHCTYLESKVIDSRPADEGCSVKRRRECIACQKRFNTYEQVEAFPLVIIKKDSSRESFSKDKLLSGLVKSCEKRPVPISTLENLVSEVEQELLSLMEREVSSDKIGVMVMDKLKKIDEVCYVRFASVYRQFKDINTFMDELKSLLND